MKDATRSACEIEAAGLGEILGLLERRVRDQRRKREALPRRAVCMVDMLDLRSTEIGIPQMKHYVLCGFVYGEDMVSLQLVSSSGFEHPHQAHEMEERHRQLVEHVTEAIRTRIDDLELGGEFPVVKGFLHPASEPRGRHTN